MNVQPIFELNETEAAFAEAYRRAAASLPGAGTGLSRVRDQAIARFEASGLPHRRIEAWHYTDLRRFLRELPDADEGAAPAGIADHPLVAAFAPLEPHTIAFIDGRFAADLSDLAGLGHGVEVRAMSAGPLPAWAADRLAEARPEAEHAVFDLNTALMADGALIRVAPEVVASRPILVLHLGRSDGTRHLRHVVVAEEGCSLTLIEAYGAIGSPDEVATASAVWRIGDGAKVEHVKVQEVGLGATHLAPQVTALGAGASLNAFTLTLGAGLSRDERHVRFDGPGTQAVVAGAYIVDGYQHADTTLMVNHAAPGSTSRELYRGIVDGEARGVFQGRIVVAPGAQKTDARQAVDVLLLSDTAEQNSKPELEIYADDVQCGHGATCGELDPNQLFYLRARGLGEAEARRMLIVAFVREGLEVIADEALREAVTTLAEARLNMIGEGGGDA